MKRLSGWDAVLLYSETPNVHMHTIKAGRHRVWTLDQPSARTSTRFVRSSQGRLNKLDPFCYQLVEMPFKFHHPMWRENCELDLDYHIRPWRVPPPGGRRELDEAIGQIASTPLDRSRPLWEMYFVEGLANNRIAVVGKIHHALADGVASANLMARGMDLQPGPEGGPYVCDPAPTTRQLMTSAFADHVRHVGALPRHRSATPPRAWAGCAAARASSSPELTRPFSRRRPS